MKTSEPTSVRSVRSLTVCDFPNCIGEIHDTHGGEFYLCAEHWSEFIAACGFRGDGLPPFPMDPDDWWDEHFARSA